MNAIDVSIILSTRDRIKYISRFIDNARKLGVNSRVELIVVDNGSSDSTPDYLNAVELDIPLKVIRQPVPGKSISLNRAIEAAAGNILLFTDDDVIFEADWISHIIQAAQQYPKANVFGGRVIIDKSKVPAWIINSYNLRTILTAEQDYGEQIFFYENGEYPVGPNIAVRKGALTGLENPWPVECGPGTSLPVGDEILFLQRVSAPVSKDRIYLPENQVLHEPDTYYVSFFSALKRCYLGGLAAGWIKTQRLAISAEKKPGMMRTFISVIRRIKSLREALCVLIRATGYMIGVIKK